MLHLQKAARIDVEVTYSMDIPITDKHRTISPHKHTSTFVSIILVYYFSAMHYYFVARQTPIATSTFENYS